MAAKKTKVKSKASAKRRSRKGKSGSTLRFPCVTFKQGKHELVLFSASAKDLYEIVSVNRREEDKDKGYQRAVSHRRAQDIASYVDEGNAPPTALVISLDDDAKVDVASQILRIPSRPDAGWVIDGQHRLVGANESLSDIKLPVVAFLSAQLPEQIHQFVTINREQKGVPTSLYYELLPSLPGVKSEKEVLQLGAKDLAKALSRDEDSPFYGRIVSTATPRTGQLSLTNVIRKLVPHVKLTSMLAHFTFDERRQIINNYYVALGEVFPKEYNDPSSLFFKTLGFGALMNALPHFIGAALRLYGSSLRTNEFRQLFAKVNDFNFTEWHGHGTGSAAELSLSNEITGRLNAAMAQAPIQTKIKL